MTPSASVSSSPLWIFPSIPLPESTPFRASVYAFPEAVSVRASVDVYSQVCALPRFRRNFPEAVSAVVLPLVTLLCVRRTYTVPTYQLSRIKRVTLTVGVTWAICVIFP